MKNNFTPAAFVYLVFVSMCPRSSAMVADNPEGSLNPPRRLKRAPRSSKRIPRWSKEGSRWFNVTLEGCKVTSKCFGNGSKMAPRTSTWSRKGSQQQDSPRWRENGYCTLNDMNPCRRSGNVENLYNTTRQPKMTLRWL